MKSRNSTKTPVKRLSNRLSGKPPKKITSTKENFIKDAYNSQERGFSPEGPIYAGAPVRDPPVNLRKPHSSLLIYVDAPMT